MLAKLWRVILDKQVHVLYRVYSILGAEIVVHIREYGSYQQ